jgi:hypothetical protein
MNKISPEHEVQSEETRIRREQQEDDVVNGIIRYAKDRYAICKECEAFSNIVKVCGECYCFMPAKVLLKDMSCPVGKWDAIDE